MNNTYVSPGASRIKITGTSACNTDKPLSNIIKQSGKDRLICEEAAMKEQPKCKKNIPQKIILITSDKKRSQEIIAKAIADTIKLMNSPI